jgi:hypothetical protein
MDRVLRQRQQPLRNHGAGVSGPGPKYQISIEGGTEPRWARNGRELFYRNGDKMMAISVERKGEALQIGAPATLFEGRFAIAQGTPRDTWYDVASDGRFLMIKPTDAQTTNAMVMIQNWSTELQARVSVAKK